MAALTGFLYACLGIYLGGWFMGYWIGNFSLLLLMLTLITFAYWMAERMRFKPAREAAASRLEREDTERRAQLARQGIDKVDGNVQEAKQRLLMQPWWLDWTAGLFPVILAVFLLRSFLFEPFKIPSGSMIPTLLVGDLILVNKYHYGIRLPVINKKIIANNDVARGDVMVFRFPEDTRVDYIKRVVGIPGDEVSYLNKQLSLNGKPVPKEALPDEYDEENRRYARQFRELLGTQPHRMQEYPEEGSYFRVGAVRPFPYRDHCRYSPEGVVCKVPPGHYFVMGDNRDNSEDSRYWGFVPDENIVGRAFVVWMNFGNLKRIGTFQ